MTPQSRLRFCIAVNSNRDIKPAFMNSLLNLQQYLLLRGVNGKPPILDLHLLSAASLLSAARQKAFDHAVSTNADYLLLLDDDMSFPNDIVDRLIKHDLDVVGVNYVSKGAGSRPTAQGADGVVYSREKTGIEEVGYMAFGCALIKMAAVREIKGPHFEVCWVPDKGSYLGEDAYFSEKLRWAGIKLHIDHDATHEIGHVGDYHYREEK